MVEVNVHPAPDFSGKTNAEVVVRQGKALDPREPAKIVVAGNIESIGAFLRQRYADEKAGFDLQKVDREKAIVLVDKDNNKIQLKLDPQNFYGTEITATLEESTELAVFGINKEREFSREDLIKLFRFNKLHFADPVKCDDLVKSLQRFSAKAYVDLTKEDDTRGNFAAAVTKKVETGIPESFVLSIPIYKGQPKITFEVSICLDVIGTRAAFWFESVQLNELLELQKEHIFSSQLECCKDFPVIHK